MKQFKKFYGLMSLALSAMFVSCGSDDVSDPTPSIPGQNERPDVTITGEMKSAQLLGFVRDTQGKALAGVTVGSGSTVTVTDASGSFALSKVEVVNGRTVVDLKKDGYFDVVRSVSMKQSDNWEIVMVSKNNSEIAAQSTYNASKAGTLKTSAGMKVEMPANGYKVDATGKDYTGSVTSELLYLDPDDDNFEAMMPGGDLAAVREDNSVAQLVSYGMLQVKMSDDKGNKLQLKDGSEAQLTFPVPDMFVGKTLPNEIPLWSFNEKTGLWEEEGVASLKGNEYVGKVKHFSWVNLDWPETRSQIKGRVVNEDGEAIPNVSVHVGQTFTQAGPNGDFECFVPANTEFDVCVESADYAFYEPVVNVHVSGINATETETIEIVLPRSKYAYGRIVNEGSATLLSTLWITYGENGMTKAVHSTIDGNFKIILPFNYRGNADLHILCGDGTILVKPIQLTGGDVNLGDVDINGTEPGAPIGKNILYATVAGEVYELDMSAKEQSEVNSFTDLLNASCIIFDNSLTLTSLDGLDGNNAYITDEFSVWNLEVDDIRKTESNARFEYGCRTSDGFTDIFGEELSCAVTDQQNKVVLNIAGSINFNSYNQKTGRELSEIGQVLGNGLTYNVALRAKTVKNITPAQCPSYTPFINNSYPYALVFDANKYFDKLITLYDDCDSLAVSDLVKQLERNGLKLVSGEPYEVGMQNWDGTFYDEAKNRIVEIEYTSYLRLPDYEVESAYDIAASLVVNVMEGAKFNFSELDAVYQVKKMKKSLRKARMNKKR